MYEFVSGLLSQCLPSNLIINHLETTETQYEESNVLSPETDNIFNNQNWENLAGDWPATCEDNDYIKEEYPEEEYTEDEKPLIRLFGYGWDPSLNDSELETSSYKKVPKSELNIGWVYGIPNRTPYIECADDDVSDNVELLDWDKTPNLLINISGFKDELISPNYKFGFYEMTYDSEWNLVEKNITSKWLQDNTSLFTLTDVIRYLNQEYNDGYYLELHMGRNPITLYKDSLFPFYVQNSELANEILYNNYMSYKSKKSKNLEWEYIPLKLSDFEDNWETLSETSDDDSDDESLIYYVKILPEPLNDVSQC
jgi:hypothetical protein